MSNTTSSDVTSFTKSQPGGSFTKVLDLDFDLSFNYPIILNGDILTSVSFAIASVGIASVYLVIRYYHYDGSTETEVTTSQQTETLSVSGGGSLTVKAITNTLKSSISTKKFKKDDILRLTVELWTKWSGLSGTFYAGFGHSPNNYSDPDNYINSTNGARNTVLISSIPTLIDL